MEGGSSSTPENNGHGPNFPNSRPLSFSPTATPSYPYTPLAPPGFPLRSYAPRHCPALQPLRVFDPIVQTELGAALLRDGIRFAERQIVPEASFMGGDNQTPFRPFMGGAAGGCVNPAPFSGAEQLPRPPSLPSFLQSVGVPTGGVDPSNGSTSRHHERKGKRGGSSAAPAAPEGRRNCPQAPQEEDIEGSENESAIHLQSKKVTDEEGQSPPVDGFRELIERTILTFDGLRRRLSQIDDAKEGTRRADLEAGEMMNRKGLRINLVKRVGPIKGVMVGDLFFFRYEMSLIGLHSTAKGAVDYKTIEIGHEDVDVAVSVIISAQDEDADDPDVAIYVEKKQLNYKRMDGGNTALETSIHLKNAVRVVRSMKDMSIAIPRMYFYDGLYHVQKSWVEKSNDHAIFKYRMFRMQGQPMGIATWRSIQQWRSNPKLRPGLILADLSDEVENLPVALVNNVDQETGPTGFKYTRRVRNISPARSVRLNARCSCQNVCVPGDPACGCARVNGGYLPYGSTGVLVRRRPFVYECGALCTCSAQCRNRVAQKGVQLRLEVFKTRDRGWGLRSWDPIRAGSFICQYTGEAIHQQIRIDSDDDDDASVDGCGDEDGDDEDGYVFKPTPPKDDPSQWNYDRELLGEKASTDEAIVPSEPLKMAISAKRKGNVARFMNHSCRPNVFWQPVAYNYAGDCYPHIMFFALKHIPSLTELTYDYGVRRGGESGTGGGVGPTEGHHRKTKKCLCGSHQCRGFFG